MVAQAADSEAVVKDEPQDTERPPKRKVGQQVDDGRGRVKENQESVSIAPKQKDQPKDETGGDQELGEEDVMAPEAEPSHPRSEVPSGSKVREEAVHVYGLDFLKTGHMEEIFGQFKHKYVEWINDSSANVVFGNAESARKALESLSYPKAGDDPWRRTPDILVHDDLPAVFLQMRLAVPSDSKYRKHAVPSCNPPQYVEESNRRNSQFTVASLYDKRHKPKPLERGPRKREPQGPPEEEIEKRRRRAARFADTLDKPVVVEVVDEVSKGDDVPAATVASEEAGKGEEETKRQKRAERFAPVPKAPPSSENPPDESEAPASQKEPEDTQAMPAKSSTPDDDKGTSSSDKLPVTEASGASVGEAVEPELPNT